MEDNTDGLQPRFTGRGPSKRSKFPRPETATIQPLSLEGLINLFTINPPNPDNNTREEIRTGKVTRHQIQPHLWSTIIVSKVRITETTDPTDGATKYVETQITKPQEVSQKILDDGIKNVEEKMGKLRDAGEFGSNEYLKQQAFRERLLDVYRYAFKIF